MTPGAETSLKGHFLIAMPNLMDPNFAHTVVCMCENSPEGSIGLVINRTYPSLLAKDLYKELKIEAVSSVKTVPVHYGGPVHLHEIFVLHGPPFNWGATLMITPYLAMSNTRDILEAIAAGLGPRDYLITLGCSGWGPNQLEAEMKENAWLTCPVSEDILFDLTLDSRWEAAVKKLGISPVLLTDTAGHA